MGYINCCVCSIYVQYVCLFFWRSKFREFRWVFYGFLIHDNLLNFIYMVFNTCICRAWFLNIRISTCSRGAQGVLNPFEIISHF